MSATHDSGEEQPLSAADRRRGLIAAIACISVYGIVGGMTGPLVSLKMEAVGIDPFMIGLNAAAMAGGILLVAPLIGMLLIFH